MQDRSSVHRRSQLPLLRCICIEKPLFRIWEQRLSLTMDQTAASFTMATPSTRFAISRVPSMAI